MESTILVDGMSCGHCEKAVKGALLAIDGINEVEVNLGSKEVKIIGSEINESAVKEAIEDAGYDII